MTAVAQLIEAAQRHQVAGRWPEALQVYTRLAQSADAPRAVISRNMAGCLLAMGKPQLALDFANRAVISDPHDTSGLWIQAKSLRAMRQSEQAERIYVALLAELQRRPDRAELRDQVLFELSELALNEFSDVEGAIAYANQVPSSRESEPKKALTQLLAQLYSRPGTAEQLTEQAVSYAQRHIQQDHQFQVPAKRKAKRRPRVGLLSIHFSVSPVYFLSHSSFAALSKSCDLVLYSRKPKQDWGRDAWQDIASEVHEAGHLDANGLAARLNEADLDAVFDLSGWMDIDGLRALSMRPVARQFKWVGGQSMTTGLSCFSAFLSDSVHTPEALAGLYTEPLAHLPEGCCRYSPPKYLPKTAQQRDKTVAGLIGNPVKLGPQSIPLIEQTVRERGVRVLRLIDRHYGHDRVQERVMQLLSAVGCDLEFVVPTEGVDRHQHFLEEVAQLGCVIDTVPHSAGLTALEALALGVPVVTSNEGKLFSERHALSHQAFYGKQKTSLAPALLSLIRDPLA